MRRLPAALWLALVLAVPVSGQDTRPRSGSGLAAGPVTQIAGPGGSYTFVVQAPEGIQVEQTASSITIRWAGAPGPGPIDPDDPLPPPPPVDPPVLNGEFELDKAAYTAGKADPALAVKLSVPFASVAGKVTSFEKPNHDDVQGMLNEAWSGVYAIVPKDKARKFLDPVITQFSVVAEQNLLADDAGYWSAARYGQAMTEIAAGLKAAAGVR
jgi:hypothetical protein